MSLSYVPHKIMKYTEITGQDERRISGYMRRAVAAKSLVDLERQFVDEIQNVVGCESPTWDNFSKDCSQILSVASHDDFIEAFAVYQDTINHTIPTHPVLSAGGWEAIDLTPQRMLDWISQSKLCDVPLYYDFYRHVGAHFQLGVRFARLSDRNLVITLNRGTVDFTTRESQLLECLCRCLGTVVQEIDHRRQMLQSIERMIMHLRGNDASLRLDLLTPSEIRLFGRIACGDQIQQIALDEDLSKHTLYKTGEAIREKLNLESNKQIKALFSPDLNMP